MNDGGRPEVIIDWLTVDRLLRIQCTKKEICSVIGVSDSTLSRRCQDKFNMTFEEYSEQKRSVGCMSLRRKQWELMSSGNVTMAIWLGKQYLGQSDKNESTINSIEPIQLNYKFDKGKAG